MRVLCLYLPQWPAQRVRGAGSPDGRPVVVHAVQKNRQRVVARCAAAAERKVTLGMPLPEVEALLAGADPLLAPLNAAADRAELERLAAACGRFGPVAGLEETERPESILIDVTGCGSFFGGEDSLAREAVALLQSQGYAARAGLADTVGLAWAASRTPGKGRMTIVPPALEGHAWLVRRPVALLRLSPEIVATLDNLGLRTVGDLLRLPRTELPSRFGPALLQRLDQALGLAPEPIEPVHLPVPPSVGWSNEIPLTNRRLVEIVLTQLLARLVARLAPWEGIARIDGWFGDEDEITIRPASPSRSARRLLELLRLALDRCPLPPEVNRIVLTAATVRLPSPEKTSLFEAERSDAEKERAFRQLVERLCGRLGEEAVLRPASTGDPLPERSIRLLPALEAPKICAPVEPADVSAAASRPVLLLPEPERIGVLSLVPDGPPYRFTRKGETIGLKRAIGPERLEAGWTSGPEARRDYWRIETDAGERYWLFRCRRSGDWFLHGLFA